MFSFSSPHLTSGIFALLWLILLPMLGCFYGKESVLYLSLMLCLLTVMTYATRKVVILNEPLVQLASTALLFLLPIHFVPYPLVWLYDKLLWFSEPGLQIVEVLGIVQLSMKLGQELVYRIDEQPNLIKGTILTISGLCYIGSAQLIYNLWYSGSAFYTWILCFTLLCLLILHIVTLKLDSGIISDAAVMTLCSFALIATMQQDLASTENKLQLPQPPDWQLVGKGASFLKLLVKIVTAGLGSVSHTWAFFSKVCTVWFLCSGLMRAASVLYSLALLHNWLTQDEEEESCDILEEDGESPADSFPLWNSAPLVRIILYFAYTQFLVHHLHLGFHASGTFLYAWTWLTSYGRLGQVLLLFVLTLYKLYKREQAEDIDDW